MILHLIRHPKPLIEAGICYGQLDIPAENPAALLAHLRDKIPAGVPLWSSPLLRCRALAEALHAAPQFDTRLMEMNFGVWEGRPWDAVPRQELDAWAADLLDYAPPGGESAAQVRRRIVDFCAQNFCDEMAVVTHAGIIRLLLSIHTGKPLAELLNYPLAYGGILSIHLQLRS